ncbi:rac GTPase-activating protein 1-like isoform X1 [Mytilus californianus]|uniref:rac GTPase-activating protein 1-like isoform X1 n=1 Tax=Mytilus californianus TaxID=6549 RepID=UPI0022472A43|nr:rac GTPase-activating protein 1-like isoform X1 [Mytilus californianus]
MDTKLTFLAAFDDLMRNAKVLQVGIEPEFRRFVGNQQECQRKWRDAEVELDRIKEKVKALEEENSLLKTKLRHAHVQIEREADERRRIEHNKLELDQQIGLVRELLCDKNSKSMLHDHDRERLAFLNTFTQQKSRLDTSPSRRLNTINESTHSILSDSDYDKTEDDLQTTYLRSGRKYKRPSAPPMEEAEPKRRRSDEEKESSLITTTTVTLDAVGKPIAATTNVTSGPQRKLNKSFSEPALDKYGSPTTRMADSEPESDDSCYATPGNRNNNRRKSRSRRTTSTADTPGMRKALSASKGLNRVHFFISKTVIKPETCTPCGKRIGFGRMAMKCKDCRASCHPDCKDSLPLPCIPTAPSTPGGTKLSGGLLSDYTPLDPPYIPGIVVHCVNEVEARGLNEIGLYRVPGSDSQVKELKKDFFKGKGIPNLSHIDDIHVICGCIKDFLRGLKEPLVTYGLWKDFVHAAENRDKCMGESEVYQAISKLPTPNRDTLAFLILHLIRVSECKECKMPSTNLAKVFGPTVIGYSVPDPEPLQMINETKYQAMVMDKFFEIPESYWEKFLNIDEENLYPNTYNTPKTPDVPKSYLGPIHTPETYENKSKTWGKNGMTPRSGSSKFNTFGSPRKGKKSKLMPPLVPFRRSISETAI